MGSNFNVMSIRQMKRLTSAAGLEIVRIYPVGMLHIPKIDLPESFQAGIDNFAMKIKCLGNISESPIAICKLRKDVSNIS